jgi:hypothetical protein
MLTQLSRLAMMTWGPLRRSTPTSGLEMLGYLPPMDLFLQGEVVKTWIRINNICKEIWDGVGTKQLGHRLKLSKLADTYGYKPYQWDGIPTIKKQEWFYKVNVESFLSGKSVEGEVQCFTDGSHYKSRMSASYCILIKDQVVAKEVIPLGTFPTLFQAEVVAILSAAD